MAGEDDSATEKSEDQKYCEKESDQVYDTIAKNQEEYDKQLLTLSTGLLAVLVAFLKDVVHLESAIYKPLLYFGLAGLGLTIMLVIASFQISIAALEDVRRYYKARYNGQAVDFPEKGAKLVKRTNWAAGYAFVIGVGLTISFITINVSHQANGGRANVSHMDTRGCSGQEPDQQRRTEGSANQSADPACTESKHYSYEYEREKVDLGR